MKKILALFLFVQIFLFSCKKDDEYSELSDSLDLTQSQSETVINTRISGVKGDGSANDSEKIQALIGSNKTLFFPKGTYVIGKYINVSNVTNLKITGEEGTVFTSGENKILLISGTISNLEISKIRFVSTKKSEVQDPEGLVFIANYGDNTIMNSIKISGCEFSNPNTQANGIKMVSEGKNSIVQNLSISNNKFLSIGRKAIEFQNHNNSPVTARYKDYIITNNYFFDIGTIQQWPGSTCITVSGYGQNGKINNNQIVDMRMKTTSHTYYGIENAGTVGLETIGNTLKSSTYGFTGIFGSNPSEADSKRTGQPLKSNWVIKDNIIELTGSNPDKNKIRGIELSYVDGYTISGNKITTDGYGIRILSSKNGKITGNTSKVKASSVLVIEGASTRNEISQNTFDNSAGADNGVIVFNGAGATGNTAHSNTLTKANNLPGSYSNINGAGNNTVAANVEVVKDGNYIQGQIGSNKTLFFPKGTYKIDKFINIANVSNLKIIGEEGTIFTSGLNKIFHVSGRISNLEIARIKFVSTRKSDNQDPEGLIFIGNFGENDVMQNINIHDCAFTNPNSHSNGIKLVSEGRNSVVQNISITNNKFESLGRMGVEFQNHNESLAKARFRDYTISNNYFYDIGTIQLHGAPVCISVSGYAVNGKINNNRILDMRMKSASRIYYGIENAGTVNLETIGNHMKSTTYGFTGILGSNPSDELVRRTGQPKMSNWIIKDNIIELTGSNPDKNKIRGMELSYVDGFTISNNKIETDSYAIRLISCKNGKITNNNIKVKGPYAFYAEGGSTRNELSYNTFDCSQGPDHGGVVVFSGGSTSGNNAFFNKLFKTNHQAGKYMNIGGASNSTR